MTEEEARIPIIKLWDCLLVPLQGDITDRQADLLTADVLRRVQTQAARGMLLDVSGVWLMDSHLCSVLARLAAAAQLMGARSIISGMKPEIVLTLQAMGVGFERVETCLNLEDALQRLGISVSRRLSDDDLAGDASAPASLESLGLRTLPYLEER